MISDSLQERIHRGDRDAFRSLYSEYSRDVYLTAQEILQDDARARAVVKQVFLRIHRELLDADGPIDTDQRIDLLTNEEIRIQRIAGGDTGSDILKEVRTPRRLDRHVEPPRAAGQQPGGPEASPLARAQRRYAAAAQPPASVEQGGTDAGRVFGLLALIVFFLIFAWAMCGILMSLGMLPTIDLGYSWFDRAVFRVFLLR